MPSYFTPILSYQAISDVIMMSYVDLGLYVVTISRWGLLETNNGVLGLATHPLLILIAGVSYSSLTISSKQHFLERSTHTFSSKAHHQVVLYTHFGSLRKHNAFLILALTTLISSISVRSCLLVMQESQLAYSLTFE